MGLSCSPGFCVYDEMSPRILKVFMDAQPFLHLFVIQLLVLRMYYMCFAFS